MITTITAAAAAGTETEWDDNKDTPTYVVSFVRLRRYKIAFFVLIVSSRTAVFVQSFTRANTYS